ncbi:MAG: ABC transporter substrate-binding protein [Acetobacteraceae bacterium]|nr:ABC transporter substrate-binding protein [Acetobacteraceae bacterium]
MLRRRRLIAAAAGGLAAPWVARAATMPGVTKTSIRIGQTMPYSGPASAYGVIGRAHAAYFDMLNASGGIGGRTIELLSADDGYSPPRTVEETRRLVESEGVSFLFNGLGTACQTAVRQYLNGRKVPQLFVSTGADKWADPEHFPWTVGLQPSYRTEAQIYAKHIQREAPAAKLAVLHQNDDFGRDYLAGLRDVLGPQYDRIVIRTASYEVTDPTVDSQVVSLHESGADTLLTAAVPKPAAQAIRKVAEIGWHPLHYLTNVSASAKAVMVPAGAENGRGIIAGVYFKDPTDPRWANDPGMETWRSFARKWAPEADQADAFNVYGYVGVLTLKHVLQQCGDDLSRENIMRRAANLQDLEIPVLLPGIKVNTSPTNFHPIRQMQLARWTGTSWELFGDVLEGSA